MGGVRCAHERKGEDGGWHSSEKATEALGWSRNANETTRESTVASAVDETSVKLRTPMKKGGIAAVLVRTFREVSRMHGQSAGGI